MKKKILKITLSVVLILILAVGLGLAYLVGAAGGGGPFDFVWKNKLKKMPGNAEKYSLENIEPLENSPLGGKRICYLGSSVTLGLYSMDVSFADYISYRNGCEYVKEAVSGTTLVDNGKTSYIQRMKNNIGTDEKFDAFVCQLSTNDASKEMPIGELSRSENLEDFDTQTITGAMEYITVYAKQTWNCPVIFYTGTKYDSKQYQQMVDALLPIRETGRIFFTIGSIDYLKHGGRIGRLAGIAASALKIKPLITLKEGEIFNSGITRNRLKSMKKVVDMTREYLDEVNAKPGEYSFCIGYGYDHNEALEFREMLKDLIKERLGIDEIGIYQIGATIGVHTGPYPIGIGIIKHALTE